MEHTTLTRLLHAIARTRIGIIGDFCLDAYLILDGSASEISLETGLPTRPVHTQRYSLGGAGNVASNLRAMGAGSVAAFGVIGNDPFGKEMRDLLRGLGIDDGGLLRQDSGWSTNVYVKPHERNREEPRIDFGNFNRLTAESAARLLEALESALPRLDIVIINEQVLSGIHAPEFRESLAELIRRHPDRRFIVDSRHYSDAYAGAMRKINVREALALHGNLPIPDGEVPAELIRSVAQGLHRRWGTTLFVTRGDEGAIVVEEGKIEEIPALLITAPVDPVGAGDSVIAGIAAALAAGATPVEAATFGGFVAGVTVQKLFQTGTASPEEITRIGSDPDYRFRTELARHPERALFLSESEIEVVTAPPGQRRFTHFLFDQDGTLSTLRQGWEEIMEPMMIEAILGKRGAGVDPELKAQIVSTVREFIDRTTGVQTLVQMRGLADLVRQFHFVPEEEILDPKGYKDLYNKALVRMVHDRMGRLRRGELDREDFALKRALPFLNAVAERGGTLYLASGTDQEDVVREAEALGYAHLFGKRIYGSVGDITKDAKRTVLERILKEIGPEAMGSVVAIGDGPVEIRETQKRGGYTIGIASSEIRRFGLNQAKRKRLVEAGADLIIPDYSQLDRLLSILFPAFPSPTQSR